ncbi:putative 2OG-Fe(II) oxygenase family oxidoreductase [Aureobasidium pullulans]|nr:putative 2OG-Fe(II) oxygenase family oxidoreductase [Aureobasidium pullulans]
MHAKLSIMPHQISPSPYADDRKFSVAELQTISFAKLASCDPEEQHRLMVAAEQDGFFYLNISDMESKGLWSDYQGVLDVMASWFETPMEEKVKFAYGSDVQGTSYKPLGLQTGATEKSKDGFETLRVAQQGLDWTVKPLPGQVLASKELFDDFINKSRMHVLSILSSLSDATGLEGEERYERSHRDDGPSNSSMTFHRYPSRKVRDSDNVGHNKHTDISSIAFLFAQQWGLQVPARGAQPEDDAWDWVQPKAGHAICNVGDSLRFLSGMRFRSVLHRVMPVAEMEHSHRYSIAYFCRPVHGTMFRDSEGRMISCDTWFSHKFDIYRATHEEQRKNTILTGGIESAESRSRIHSSVVV